MVSPPVIGTYSEEASTGNLYNIGMFGYGHASPFNNYGILGQTENDGNNNCGVKGISNTASTSQHQNCGIFGQAATSGTGFDWAGYFDGDVYIYDGLNVGGDTTIAGSVGIPNGNVGIGTNSPTALLHIVSTSITLGTSTPGWGHSSKNRKLFLKCRIRLIQQIWELVVMDMHPTRIILEFME